jgi:hypothetical protein
MDDKRTRELIENMTGKEIFHLLAYRPRLLEEFREVILSEYTCGTIKSYDILAALEHRRALGD